MSATFIASANDNSNSPPSQERSRNVIETSLFRGINSALSIRTGGIRSLVVVDFRIAKDTRRLCQLVFRLCARRAVTAEVSRGDPGIPGSSNRSPISWQTVDSIMPVPMQSCEAREFTGRGSQAISEIQQRRVEEGNAANCCTSRRGPLKGPAHAGTVGKYRNCGEVGELENANKKCPSCEYPKESGNHQRA